MKIVKWRSAPGFRSGRCDGGQSVEESLGSGFRFVFEQAGRRRKFRAERVDASPARDSRDSLAASLPDGGESPKRSTVAASWNIRTRRSPLCFSHLDRL